MNTEPPESEFAKLKTLLALKRHEQPPPGYFDRLPGQILARIERDEDVRGRPWWERWFNAPLSSPALGWAYAGLALALVLGGGMLGRMVRANQQANAVKPGPVTVPASPALVIADTNGTSSPPAFLVQPGSTLVNTQQTLPAGFKQP
jgi:hypothetical protein